MTTSLQSVEARLKCAFIRYPVPFFSLIRVLIFSLRYGGSVVFSDWSVGAVVGQLYGGVTIVTGEHLIDIEEEYEFRSCLAHAAEKIHADLGAESGRRQNILGWQVGDLAHRIGNDPHNGFVPFKLGLDDNDTATVSDRARGQSELQCEIDDGNHASAQIDDPTD